jgi:acyl-CoA synthetase (AMP-forming)/AMP-acid ligase II
VRFLTNSNIASHLPKMAAEQPNKRAVVIPAGRDPNGRLRWVHYTFAELDEASDRYAIGLERVGIKRGVRTVLMVPPSLEFFAMVFALFKVGAVTVMIDPGSGLKALKQCLREVEPEAFIGVSIAHVARLVMGSALKSIKIPVTVGKRWFWGGHRLRDLKDAGPYQRYAMDAPDPGQEAAILFTSGSTGIPKGAVYTHGMFTAQVESLKQMFRFAPDEIDLATFPLFALFDPALGMTSVIPEMDARKPGEADPAKIAEAILTQGCTSLFASPALLRNLGRWGHETGTTLPPLRRVMSSGAPARRETLEQITRMLTGGAQMFTPYGATEVLPVANIGSDEVLGSAYAETARGAGICVGKPVEGATVRVIKITDDAIARWSNDLLVPDGEIGEITVKAAQVTHRYWGRPQQTAEAKIADGDEIVHRMGDAGYFDPQGRLWMCGRTSHRVRTAAGDVFTVPAERIFDEHPGVRQTALVGLGEPGEEQPVLLVEREQGFADLTDAVLVSQLEQLRGDYEAASAVTKIVVYGRPFPVDIRHNAKIVREDLRVWANKNL